MKRTLATFLVFVFSLKFPLDCQAQTFPRTPLPAASKLKEQLTRIPIDAEIEVRFIDKTKLRGYLSAVESDGFGLTIGNVTTGTVRHVAFADVRSVKVAKSTHTPVAAWLLAGAIVGVVVCIVAVIVAERRNE